jgi:hypothetical protein
MKFRTRVHVIVGVAEQVVDGCCVCVRLVGIQGSLDYENSVL